MTPEEQKVVEALKASFIATIEGLGGTVDKAGVTMPKDEVWLRYARVAIEAIKSE